MSKAKKKPAARAKPKAAPKKTKSAPKLKKPRAIAKPAKKKVSSSAETREHKAVVRSSPPKPPQPDVTAPPPPIRPARPRRVSIGEALAQLNAATLEGVTAELTPFGLSTEVELTPNPGLAALVGVEPRPLSVLVGALEAWGARRSENGAALEFGRREHDGDVAQPATSDESANLILVAEAQVLLAEQPRIREALEGFVKRNCRL